jgi:hypothetical protein
VGRASRGQACVFCLVINSQLNPGYSMARIRTTSHSLPRYTVEKSLYQSTGTNPEGASFDLEVTRLPRRNDSTAVRLGSLFINPRGPGSSTAWTLTDIAGGGFDKLSVLEARYCKLSCRISIVYWPSGNSVAAKAVVLCKKTTY